MSKKVTFLYFYGLHQLYHSAMTAMEMGVNSDEFDVVCLSCNSEHTQVLNEIKSYYPTTKTKIIEIKQPFRYKYLNFKKKTYPSVNAMMKRSKPHLIDTDMVVTTSHGTVKMLRKYGINRPKVIYQYHGVGDRKYGFDPEFKKFNFMLLPGKYHQDRLVQEEIIDRKNTKIVGWPKLDYVEKLNTPPFFKNSNPIVLYTPHWTPELTSYKIYAEFILEYFKHNTHLNLIFAPHLLIKHWRFAHNYNIDFDHYNSDNIRVDFGSKFSTNGAYLKYADIYLGDVSSMVFEFISINPRPCVYLNAHQVDWRGNLDYRFWDFGEVVEHFDEFGDKINKSISNDQHKDLQIERYQEYLNITKVPSSKRAAEAIKEFL